VALYFWVLTILMPLSRIKRPTRALSADCFAIACQAMGDQRSILIPAALRSSVASRSFLGLSGAVHGYELGLPYHRVDAGSSGAPAMRGKPRDVTRITLHRNSTGHSSFQASMKANLTGFGLQRRLPPFLALPACLIQNVALVRYRSRCPARHSCWATARVGSFPACS